MPAQPSPSQTIGPFFRHALDWMDATHLVDKDHDDAIVIEGTVWDGAGEPVADAVIEIWQADAAGAFPPNTAPGWTGFGRDQTDDAGRYRFITVTPGAVDQSSDPHIDVSLFARGLLHRVVTRLYLPDTAVDEPRDPVLAMIPGDRRSTLVAEATDIGLRFDICLQGPHETVFFAW